MQVQFCGGKKTSSNRRFSGFKKIANRGLYTATLLHPNRCLWIGATSRKIQVFKSIGWSNISFHWPGTWDLDISTGSILFPFLHQTCEIHPRSIHSNWDITLPKTNICSPWCFFHPKKGNVTFQLSICRCYVKKGTVIPSLPKIRQDQIPIDQRSIAMWMFPPLKFHPKHPQNQRQHVMSTKMGSNVLKIKARKLQAVNFCIKWKLVYIYIYDTEYICLFFQNRKHTYTIYIYWVSPQVQKKICWFQARWATWSRYN